jgi:hypothetical protein
VCTRRQYSHVVVRLEQRDLAGLGGLAQGERSRALEGRVGGVDTVRLAVGERDPDVDHGVAMAHTALHLGAYALLDRADELPGHGTADDLVEELEAGSLR